MLRIIPGVAPLTSTNGRRSDSQALPISTSPPPPTMTGETLAFTGSPSDLFNFPCSSPGSYTVSFDVSGTASGPYAGTFEETGTLSYTIPAPYHTDNAATITGYAATFTITSDTGMVTGNRDLDTTAVPGTINCGHHSPTAGFILSGLPTTFTSTIWTPTGNYQDEGTSMVDQSWYRTGQYGQITGSNFDASHTSALTAPILIVPTSINDCLSGGWQNFPQFANEGACVSFLAVQQGT